MSLRKTITFLMVASAILLCRVNGAHATVITPTAGNNTAIPVPSNGPVSGVVIDQNFKTFTSTNGAGTNTITARINQAVIREASGHLDFLYQVQIISNLGSGPRGTLNTLNLLDFTGVQAPNGGSGVDVYQSQNPLAGVFVTGTSGLNSASISIPGADQITTTFGSIGTAGQASYTLIVRTNSYDYTATGNATTNRANDSAIRGIFNPVATPEPASLVLLAGSAAGFGLVSWRKRRRVSQQVS